MAIKIAGAVEYTRLASSAVHDARNHLGDGLTTEIHLDWAKRARRELEMAILHAQHAIEAIDDAIADATEPRPTKKIDTASEAELDFEASTHAPYRREPRR